MQHQTQTTIIGAGIAGISAAYYLYKSGKCDSITLIDPREVMSYTTAQSGDNYRDWWPSDVMTDFCSQSIELMRELAFESDNAIELKHRGYLLAKRRGELDSTLKALEAAYPDQIRIHESNHSNYKKANASDWRTHAKGVDVITSQALIKEHYPNLSSDIDHLIHVRNAGDFSSQLMGSYMLSQIPKSSLTRIRGRVVSIERNSGYLLSVEGDNLIQLSTEVLINAAGPFVGEVAEMLGVELPVRNVFQQKLAFEDTLGVVPRDQPFTIDLDPIELQWSDEERAALQQDPNLKWLTQTIAGGAHCRPEGAGRWVKLGWAYNQSVSHAEQHRELIDDANYDANFPEIVLRGASKLNPGLTAYLEQIPTKRSHYGGYYTLTEENWPLIGKLDSHDAYVLGALSGFGCMAACAAGSLIADHIAGNPLPDYAEALSPQRYDNPTIMQQISDLEGTGIL